MFWERVFPGRIYSAPYRDRAPKAVKDNRGFTFVMMEGKLTPKPVGKACSFVGAPRSHHPQVTTGMTDPVVRLKDMDLEGIDTAVLFGTSPFLSLPFVEDKDLASAVARVYNNWLAGYCKSDGRRLKGVAAVAIQDPSSERVAPCRPANLCRRRAAGLGLEKSGLSTSIRFSPKPSA
jgi:predicted TIM-barrel fold metal-dependent hydrolase